MNIYTEDEQSMLLGTEVDIYPAGEPRYTEKEFAEKLHSMLQEIEEAQPDSCAITALIPDMLMVDNEDVPVFGVVQNIHNATESFDEDMYVTGDTPIEAAEKVLGAVVKEKSPEDMTFQELAEALKSNLEELRCAIEDYAGLMGWE